MGWFSTTEKNRFPWIELVSEEQLDALMEESRELPVAFFKHSTRCSISAMALSRFEQKWNPELPVRCVYLDLLNYRPLSNKLSELAGVEHQSPQLLVFKNKELVYNASHNGIDAEALKSTLEL